MQMAALNTSIQEAVPHIFKRPLLSVRPTDSLLQVGTFLAIGPQIYVDGLVVIDDNQKAAGTIGGQHMIEYILYHKSDWLGGTASSIMTRFDSAVKADRPLNAVLDVFAKTGFAFAPITVNHKVVTSISLRDILKVVAGLRLDTPVREISSPIIAIDGKVSIGDALEIMLEQGIRNLVVKVRVNGSQHGILNDRKILEFLISHEGRQVMISKGVDGLFDIKVDSLDLTGARLVNSDMHVSDAAGIFDVNVPCLLLDDSILTPWDIVMKGLKRVGHLQKQG